MSFHLLGLYIDGQPFALATLAAMFIVIAGVSFLAWRA